MLLGTQTVSALKFGIPLHKRFGPSVIQVGLRWMTSDKFLTRAVLIVCKSHIPSAIDLKAIMGDFLLQSSLELQKRFGNFVNLCLTDFTCRLWELLLLGNVWL